MSYPIGRSILTDFEIREPRRIGVLEPEPDDAPLVEGEVLVFPAPRGGTIDLRFAGPFEPYLTLDGRRVVEATCPDDARLLTWLGRRLPALDRALELGMGLTACLHPHGVEVIDVVELEDQIHYDHARTIRILADCEVQRPAFGILGPVAGLVELQSRLRGMYASGTLVEVRREEGGRVLGRRQVRVGR